MEPVSDGEHNLLIQMISDLQAQVTGLTTTVRCLIEAQSDRSVVDVRLARAYARLDGLMNGSDVPDQMIGKTLSLIASMRLIAGKELDTD